MTKTTKIMGILALSSALASSAMAKDMGGFLQVGYGSAKIASESTGAVVVDFGAKFGQTYKQSIGFRVVFSGENDDWNDGTGNVGEMYYTLGYEVFQDTTLAAKVGYAFEDIGQLKDSTAYATGITYGAVAKYALSDSFDIVATYTRGDLKFESIDHTYEVADVGISYTF